LFRRREDAFGSRSHRQRSELLGTGYVLDQLAEPAGVEDIELALPTSDELARPAGFA
jgi:hypothetical protein